MAKTLTIPTPKDLPFTVESVASKLPGTAIHNRLHEMADQMGQAIDKLEHLRTPLVILTGLQLESEFCSRVSRGQKGKGWAAWVKGNCKFSRATADRYRRVVEMIRNGSAAGALPALTDDILPEQSPGEMSASELQDALRSLGATLDGVGVRQLYLELELITQPGNKPKLGDKKETARERSAREKAEALRDSSTFLKRFTQFVGQKRHGYLKKEDRLALADSLEQVVKDLRRSK